MRALTATEYAALANTAVTLDDQTRDYMEAQSWIVGEDCDCDECLEKDESCVWSTEAGERALRIHERFLGVRE